MSSIDEIHIAETIPPIGLLQCKKLLNQRQAGDIICVCMHDRQTVEHLRLIVAHSKDKIIKQQHENDTYRIYIQKG